MDSQALSYWNAPCASISILPTETRTAAGLPASKFPCQVDGKNVDRIGAEVALKGPLERAVVPVDAGVAEVDVLIGPSHGHILAPVGPEVRFLHQTVFTIVARKQLRLTDERHDSARDQIPVLLCFTMRISVLRWDMFTAWSAAPTDFRL